MEPEFAEQLARIERELAEPPPATAVVPVQTTEQVSLDRVAAHAMSRRVVSAALNGLACSAQNAPADRDGPEWPAAPALESYSAPLDLRDTRAIKSDVLARMRARNKNLAERPRLSRGRPRIVGIWDYGPRTDEECTICRAGLMARCQDCQAHCGSGADDNCVIQWGACGHIFHRHCITTWTRYEALCPLCMAPWAVVRESP